jgi:enamine deaminase RidA (YjgF/YER057c/UK114 family)
MEGVRSISGKSVEHAAQSGQGWQGPVGIGDLARICNAQICRCSDALSVLRGLARHSGARVKRANPEMTPMANRRTLLMRILQPAEWSKPRGFSHGVAVDGPGRWIVLAGQTGGDEKGEYQSDMAGQVGMALRRIIKLLAEAGAGPEHIVRLTWYLTSRGEYEAAGAGIGAAWRETLGKNFPPSTLLYIAGLVDQRAKVEIEVTAFVPAA